MQNASVCHLQACSVPFSICSLSQEAELYGCDPGPFPSGVPQQEVCEKGESEVRIAGWTCPSIKGGLLLSGGT